MMTADPLEHWHALLPAEDAGAMCARLTDRMRAGRLRFGDRVICPFLRPFFLDAADEPRVTRVAETLWRLGERVTSAALASPEMLRQLALSDDEIRLARIDPGYATTSTAARADAFILPDSLQFAEYNGESPAGAGYSQGLAELFSDDPTMARFRERFDCPLLPAGGGAARGAGRELSRVGRESVAAAHGDRRLARGADLQRIRNPAGRVHLRSACRPSSATLAI
jgi:hypothetical protein